MTIVLMTLSMVLIVGAVPWAWLLMLVATVVWRVKLSFGSTLKAVLMGVVVAVAVVGLLTALALATRVAQSVLWSGLLFAAVSAVHIALLGRATLTPTGERLGLRRGVVIFVIASAVVSLGWALLPMFDGKPKIPGGAPSAAAEMVGRAVDLPAKDRSCIRGLTHYFILYDSKTPGSALPDPPPDKVQAMEEMLQRYALESRHSVKDELVYQVSYLRSTAVGLVPEACEHIRQRE